MNIPLRTMMWLLSVCQRSKERPVKPVPSLPSSLQRETIRTCEPFRSYVWSSSGSNTGQTLERCPIDSNLDPRSRTTIYFIYVSEPSTALHCFTEDLPRQNQISFPVKKTMAFTDFRTAQLPPVKERRDSTGRCAT